jgi:hypothetical protein
MKTVSIGKRPGSGGRPSPEEVDKWLENQSAGGGETASPITTLLPAREEKAPSKPAPAVEAIKRLTIDIPDSLHRRVKSGCGKEGVRMVDVVRELLEKRFPED